MTFLQNTVKRRLRRGWPIMGYVGPNGAGKSAAMVWDTLPTLESGRHVLSTVRLLDYENPRECDGCVICDASGKSHPAAHPLWVRLTSWRQVLDAAKCDLLLDEVTGVASSRDSASMPSPVANRLVQLRRTDVVVRWSAPAWARSDKIIRECSQGVVYARGYMAKAAEPDEDGQERMWRNRRLFRWQLFDANDFEDFTAGKREQLKPVSVDWHWGPNSPAFRAYDSFDSVDAIGTVTDSGRCYQCGGRRSVPACKCPDNHSAPQETRPEGPRVAGIPAPSPGGRRVLRVASPD